MKYLLILFLAATFSCTQSEQEKPIAQIKYEGKEGEEIVDVNSDGLQRIMEIHPDAIIVKFYDQSGNGCDIY